MQKTEKASRKTLRNIALGVGAVSFLTVPIALEVRLKQATQPLTDAWQHLPIEPRRSTLLGISFRSPHVAMLGLDARATLQTFSYPEFFVPAHHLKHPFPEHTLIKPSAYPSLLTAATEFITRLVERYKQRKGIVAWQLEHEAVDPLGVEHTWRLDLAFVEKEVETLRRADPTRPIMMNGFLPTSLPVRLSQWWRTRDQGDSLAVAQRMADMVGIDYYPRHALMTVGSKTLYLDGSKSPWQQRRKQLFAWTRAHGQKLMI